MKKIRKNYSGVVPNGKVLNSRNNSLQDTYSSDYLNRTIDGLTKLKVSSSEPTTGEEVWLQKGNDVFNKDNITLDYRLDSSGQPFLHEGIGAFLSDFIEVKPNTQYVTSWGIMIMRAIALYDSNKNFISRITENNLFTTTNETKYIRVCGYINELGYMYIQEGTSIIPRNIYLKDNGKYEEFTDTVSAGINHNNAKVWFEKSNNILKFEDFTTTLNGVTFSMKNQVLTIKGTATAYIQGGYIPIKKTLKEPETLTAEVDGTGVIPKVSYSYNGQYTYPNLTTVELKQDTYIDQLYFIISEGTTVNATVKLQLEKGSGYSGWQPYIDKKIYTKNDNGVYEELINTSAINSLIPQIKDLTPNYEYLYEDFQYNCVQIGKVVFLNIGVLSLRQAVINGELLISGLPPSAGGYVGALHGHTGSNGQSIRCVINADGTLKVHWGGTDSIGDAANKQFAGTFIYITD